MSRPAEGGAKHAWRARWLSAMLIEPARDVARTHGYAIGEHGSRSRDIDWIAVPWIDDPASPRVLADAIVAKIAELNHGMAFVRTTGREEHDRQGTPGDKPHGRLCWSIHLGGGPYIDLSVMPPVPQ